MNYFALEGAPNENPNEVEAKAIERRDAEWLAARSVNVTR